MKRAVGRIILVQEDRFRLKTDDGTVLLLTTSHKSGITVRELQRLHVSEERVRVEYEGEPNIDSAIARSLRMEPKDRIA